MLCWRNWSFKEGVRRAVRRQRHGTKRGLPDPKGTKKRVGYHRDGAAGWEVWEGKESLRHWGGGRVEEHSSVPAGRVQAPL